MTDERGVVRSISWRDLFPWLILLRTFRIAIQPTLLAVATVATLAMAAGWWAGGWIFLAEYDEEKKSYVVALPHDHGLSLADLIPPAAREYLPAAATGLVEPFLRLAEPLRHLFHVNVTVRETAYYLFGTLVSLAIWALAGGFITRHAILRLATDQKPEAQGSARFAAQRYLWYFLAPLYPLLGVLLLGIPIALLGIPIYFAPGVGSIVAGLLWIFVVIASLGAAWLVAGLLFGWPLMWPAISAERDGTPFEAFSRSFSFVYGKPLHYFFYVVVAALFGALGYAVVHVAALLVTEFGFWALSWGAGSMKVQEIRGLVDSVLRGDDLSGHENRTLVFGSSLFALVVGLIRTVETAFTYSFFWCVAAAIYLLLRMDVDEKEMDEVYVETQPKPAAPTTSTPPPTTATSPTVAPAATERAAAPPPTDSLQGEG